jgi:single-stranded DNA-binding protein
MSQEIIQYIQTRQEEDSSQSKWTDKDFVRRYQKEYRQRLKERIQLIKENNLEPTKKSEDPNYYENYKKKPKVEKIENLTQDLTEYNKSYYQKNREKLLSRSNEYNKKNSEYYECECGCMVQRKNTNHKKTEKHLRKLLQRKEE